MFSSSICLRIMNDLLQKMVQFLTNHVREQGWGLRGTSLYCHSTALGGNPATKGPWFQYWYDVECAWGCICAVPRAREVFSLLEAWLLANTATISRFVTIRATYAYLQQLLPTYVEMLLYWCFKSIHSWYVGQTCMSPSCHTSSLTHKIDIWSELNALTTFQMHVQIYRHPCHDNTPDITCPNLVVAEF